MPKSTSKVAIVLHIYYLEVADRMLQQLSPWIGQKFSVWVTVPVERRAQVEALLTRHGLAAQVRDYDNTGMDVLPFLSVLPELVERGYTAVVKLHTKRGADAASAVWGATLLEGMCREPVLEAIDRAFGQYADLDIVGLAQFYLSAQKLKLNNEPLLSTLVNEVPNLNMPLADWGFFAGTMFAARIAPLLPLAEWALENVQRFSSAYQSDGLWEHALERAFGIVARQQGSSVGLIHAVPDHNSVTLQRARLGEGISQAYSRELANQLKSFERDYAILVRCDLLDTSDYRLEGETVGAIDLYRHYLLIGQFDDRVSASKAWSLSRHNDRRLPWSQWCAEPRESDLVSVVVPVFNQPELTEQCIRTLFAAKTAVRFEVVCVDNGSEAATSALLARLAQDFPWLRLVSHGTNLNFALGCNTGFGHSRGARVVFLNNDTSVTDGWLDHLVARLDLGDCFAVQPQLRYPDGTLQCMGVVFSDKSTLGYPVYAKMTPSECVAGQPRNFKALTGACMAVNACDFAEMKGFDALYINGQEDIDLCLRLHEKSGKLGAYVPESVVIHHESKSEGRGRWIAQNRRVFVHRWGGKVSADDHLYYKQDGFKVLGWKGDNEQEDIRVYRPSLEVDSERVSPLNASLKRGHESFVEGDYTKALKNFALASSANGDLKWIFDQCTALVKRAIAVKGVSQTAIVCMGAGLSEAVAALAELHEGVPVIVLCLIKHEGAGAGAVLVEPGDRVFNVSLHDRYSVSDQLRPVVLEYPLDKVFLLGDDPLVSQTGKLFGTLWGTQVYQL